MTNESKDTGGPAFPCEGVVTNDGILYEGMTLRDYFAAKAMQSILQDYDPAILFDAEELAKPLGIPSTSSLIAEDAYLMADAMLKARKE